MRELGLGDVAAAVTEIARHVAQHVRHLQRLAEAHALRAHARDVPAGEARAMRHVHVGPELADASRDEVDVAVEVGERAERGEVRGVLAAKGDEVERHAARERREHVADGAPVGRRQALEARDRFRQPREQLGLRAVRPMRAARGGHAGDIGRCAAERRAQRLEMGEPRLTRDEPRVGHGVRRAREEVGEPDGRAEIARQDPEREVEASADSAQQPAQEIIAVAGGCGARHSPEGGLYVAWGARGAQLNRSGAGAGPASPSPSSGSPGTFGPGACPSAPRPASAA